MPDETPQTELILTDPHHEREDLAMIKRAIRNDWPITDEMRAKLVRRMSRITRFSPDERNAVGAAKALLTADSLNIKREQMDQAEELKNTPDKHLHLHGHANAQIVIQLPDNGR